MKSHRWIKWVASRNRRWELAATVEAADEVPDQIPKRGVVLVGTQTHPRWLAFDCPCGTGHRIMLNTDRSRYPCWTVRHLSPMTVWPSIDDVTEKRRCHFWIHDGKTRWVRGLERSWRK